MKAVASPDVAQKVVRRRKPLANKKYIVTLLQRRRFRDLWGSPRKDAAIVDKILRKLGYLPQTEAARKKKAGSLDKDRETPSKN